MNICFEELGLRNWTKLLKLALYLEYFCHSAELKNSNTQFPLTNFARIGENLLVSELLEVYELAYL